MGLILPDLDVSPVPSPSEAQAEQSAYRRTLGDIGATADLGFSIVERIFGVGRRPVPPPATTDKTGIVLLGAGLVVAAGMVYGGRRRRR